jgi:hypothetical protein
VKYSNDVGLGNKDGSLSGCFRVRPEGEVEMVGYPARDEQTPRHTSPRLAQEFFEEGSAIAVFGEDGSATIAPVEDMVAVAAQRCAGVAWHEGGYGDFYARRQAYAGPFFVPRASGIA